MKIKFSSDLERVRNTSDEEAQRIALADPDAQPLTEDFLRTATRVAPKELQKKPGPPSA